MTVILQGISSYSACAAWLDEMAGNCVDSSETLQKSAIFLLTFFFYYCLIDRRELEPLEIVVVLLGNPLTRGSYLDLVF